MRYKRLGKTGLYVSELCLGTMTYGGKGFWKVIGELGVDAASRQLKMAVDAGVNFVDTADVYHEGEAERLTGEAIKKLGLDRRQLVVATKVRGRTGEGVNDTGLSRKHIYDAIDASLKRLDMDYVDLYQIHGLDPATPLEETLEALDDVVRQGKVRYIGFCNLPAYKAMKALAISDHKGWSRFVSAQMYYTIAGRDIEREIAPLCQEEGLGILPWSPLAGGLLTGKFKPGSEAPEGTRRASFDFPPVDRERAFACVDAMRKVTEAHDATVAQVALGYLLHKPFVTSVIIGARTDEQLRDNLGSVRLELSEQELSALDEVSALSQEYPGWMVTFQNRERYIEGQQP